jgi:hypothetical protein
MAKISIEEQAAIEAGYREGERCQRAYGKARYENPYLWSSRMWEAFEFGYFLQEKGLPLRAYERGRGNTYRNADGFTFKIEYGKAKGSFGITRQK